MVFRNTLQRANRFLLDEDGPTATEYAVMLALVLAVIIATVTTFGRNLDTQFDDINSTCFGS